MTENEAIKRIKFRIETATDIAGKGVNGKAYEDMEMAVKALDEIQQYRSIGTVSECREAAEKQKAKIPNIWGDGYADGQLVYDMYDCPNCGESYEIDYHDYTYCPKCGQKIDRTDLEKMEDKFGEK